MSFRIFIDAALLGKIVKYRGVGGKLAARPNVTKTNNHCGTCAMALKEWSRHNINPHNELTRQTVLVGAVEQRPWSLSIHFLGVL